MQHYGLRNTLKRKQREDKTSMEELSRKFDHFSSTLTSLGSVISDLKTEFKDFKREIKDLKISFDTKVGNLEELLKKNAEDLNKLSEKSDTQAQTITCLKAHNVDLEAQLKAMKELQTSQATELHHAELRSRSFNLRIAGLPELEQEDTIALAAQYLREKDLLKGSQITHESIEIAHRVGRREPNKTKPRPIIIRFFRRSDVNSILADVKDTNFNKNSKVKIARDRPRREMELRNKAYRQMKEAWERGIPATINRNLQLVINGTITDIEDTEAP